MKSITIKKIPYAHEWKQAITLKSSDYPNLAFSIMSLCVISLVFFVLGFAQEHDVTYFMFVIIPVMYAVPMFFDTWNFRQKSLFTKSVYLYSQLTIFAFSYFTFYQAFKCGLYLYEKGILPLFPLDPPGSFFFPAHPQVPKSRSFPYEHDGKRLA